MVNTCKSLINAVIEEQAEGAVPHKGRRPAPKGEWSGIGIVSCPIADRATTGGQAGPKPSIRCVRGTW